MSIILPIAANLKKKDAFRLLEESACLIIYFTFTWVSQYTHL